MLKTGFRELDEASVGPIEGEVNVLLCDKPYGKAYFTSKLVAASLKQGNVVYYIDLDTSFTAYLQAGLLHIPSLENLLVYNPSKENIDDIVSQVCSTLPNEQGEVIILDSVATLYHMLASEQGAAEVNRRFGLYLALLQTHALSYNSTTVVTSLMRAKKVGGSSWVQSYPGGRVLMTRGQVILELKEGQGYLDTKVIKHKNLSLEGRVTKLPF